MHSSTSNFKRSIPNVPWLRVLAIAASVAVALICSAEITLRSLGYTPTVVDDPDLWSLERSRVGSSTNSIVLIGNSQMMWNISPEVIKEHFTNMNVRMLAVEGSSPVPVLADLATDFSFRGIVLCVINPVDILPLEHEEQAELVEYFHHKFSKNKAINRQISTFFQKHFVFMDPYASPKRLMQERLTSGRLPDKRPVLTCPDRSRQFDYSLVNVPNRRSSLFEGTRLILEKASSMGDSVWFDHARMLNDYGKAIQTRGGMVIFWHFPISPEAWSLQELYFPRVNFWDRFAMEKDVHAIHFKDFNSLSSFYCPDHYHVDASSIKEFTEIFCILNRKHISD